MARGGEGVVVVKEGEIILRFYIRLLKMHTTGKILGKLCLKDFRQNFRPFFPYMIHDQEGAGAA